MTGCAVGEGERATAGSLKSSRGHQETAKKHTPITAIHALLTEMLFSCRIFVQPRPNAACWD